MATGHTLLLIKWRLENEVVDAVPLLRDKPVAWDFMRFPAWNWDLSYSYRQISSFSTTISKICPTCRGPLVRMSGSSRWKAVHRRRPASPTVVSQWTPYRIEGDTFHSPSEALRAPKSLETLHFHCSPLLSFTVKGLQEALLKASNVSSSASLGSSSVQMKASVETHRIWHCERPKRWRQGSKSRCAERTIGQSSLEKSSSRWPQGLYNSIPNRFGATSFLLRKYHINHIYI